MPDSRATLEDRVAALLRARAGGFALTAREHRMVMLHYGEGFTLTETGEALGLSAESVKTVIAKARQRIDEMLEDAGVLLPNSAAERRNRWGDYLIVEGLLNGVTLMRQFSGNDRSVPELLGIAV